MAQKSSSIRVIIADDSDFVRDGMNIILGMDPAFEVAGCAANGREALELARTRRADVILMDIQMPVMDGIEATGAIVREELGKVLILTTFDDDDLVAQALKNGAQGYLIKNHAPEVLKQMIQSIHQGIHVLDEKAFDRLTGEIAGQAGSPPAPAAAHKGFDESPFTARELDIIREIARGLSNREIAEALYVGEGTIKNHISAILSKSECSHRTQLAVYYLTGERRKYEENF